MVKLTDYFKAGIAKSQPSLLIYTATAKPATTPSKPSQSISGGGFSSDGGGIQPQSVQAPTGIKITVEDLSTQQSKQIPIAQFKPETQRIVNARQPVTITRPSGQTQTVTMQEAANIINAEKKQAELKKIQEEFREKGEIAAEERKTAAYLISPEGRKEKPLGAIIKQDIYRTTESVKPIISLVGGYQKPSEGLKGGLTPSGLAVATLFAIPAVASGATRAGAASVLPQETQVFLSTPEAEAAARYATYKTQQKLAEKAPAIPIVEQNIYQFAENFPLVSGAEYAFAKQTDAPVTWKKSALEYLKKKGYSDSQAEYLANELQRSYYAVGSVGEFMGMLPAGVAGEKAVRIGTRTIMPIAIKTVAKSSGKTVPQIINLVNRANAGGILSKTEQKIVEKVFARSVLPASVPAGMIEGVASVAPYQTQRFAETTPTDIALGSVFGAVSATGLNYLGVVKQASRPTLSKVARAGGNILDPTELPTDYLVSMQEAASSVKLPKGLRARSQASIYSPAGYANILGYTGQFSFVDVLSQSKTQTQAQAQAKAKEQAKEIAQAQARAEAITQVQIQERTQAQLQAQAREEAKEEAQAREEAKEEAQAQAETQSLAQVQVASQSGVFKAPFIPLPPLTAGGGLGGIGKGKGKLFYYNELQKAGKVLRQVL